MDARGKERPLGKEREAHRGREFLGLRGGVRVSGGGMQKPIFLIFNFLTHISNAKVRLYAPQTGSTARDDERGGNAEGFERV